MILGLRIPVCCTLYMQPRDLQETSDQVGFNVFEMLEMCQLVPGEMLHGL